VETRAHLSYKRADSGVKTQRLVFCFVLGQNWRFCALFGGLCQQAANRVLKA
jgi:hypothetical protein